MILKANKRQRPLPKLEERESRWTTGEFDDSRGRKRKDGEWWKKSWVTPLNCMHENVIVQRSKIKYA